MKDIKIFIFLALFTIPSLSQAQVSDFLLINAVNNNEVSLSSFSSRKAVVIIFTSNYCPYSKLYEQRIKALNEEYSSKGVQVLLINPNDPISSKNDSVEEMKKRAEENSYSFPYLADKDQKVSTEFKATKTPHAFVVVPRGGKFNIVYRGAIDDNPQVDTDVSQDYLKEALDAILSGGNPSTAKTSPTGCIIKRN